MRVFNEDQIEDYITSAYCIEQYKNKTIDELKELQHTDIQLQNELAFIAVLKRAYILEDQENQSQNEIERKIQEEQIQQQLLVHKRIEELTNTYSENSEGVYTVEIPNINTTKNYINLFQETLANEDQWTKAELIIREQFLQEYASYVKKPGGCSSCKRGALVRKYITKIEELNNNILK